jgi:hypothetical protein
MSDGETIRVVEGEIWFGWRCVARIAPGLPNIVESEFTGWLMDAAEALEHTGRTGRHERRRCEGLRRL